MGSFSTPPTHGARQETLRGEAEKTISETLRVVPVVLAPLQQKITFSTMFAINPVKERRKNSLQSVMRVSICDVLEKAMTRIEKKRRLNFELSSLLYGLR